MKQGRSTTQEERIQIVKDCIASGKNYGEMALKYQVNYQQVRTWTHCFEKLREAGLEDRRGRRKKDQTPRSELKQAQVVSGGNGARPAKKIGRGGEERCLSEVRQRHIYAAIKECHEEKGYPIETACGLLHVSRSAYHKRAAGKLCGRAEENERLADRIEKIHSD